MSRSEEAAAILAAAAQWRDRCLLEQKSVFTDRALWTNRNFQQLDRHFVHNLDEGEGDFFGKLSGQLSTAQPSARQLASELFWVMYLVVHPSAMGAETKRYQIKQVWEWSGEPFPSSKWALDDLLEKGVVHPGPAYDTHRWRELRFFITMMLDWSDLSSDRRAELLEDPWGYSQWLEEREYARGRQFPHVLRFLLFPDHFEPILSGAHKKKIVQAFHAKWGDSPDVDYVDRVAVDKAVLAVRERLESEMEGDEVSFYRSPLEEVWRGKAQGTTRRDPGGSREIAEGSSTTSVAQGPTREEGDAEFRARFGGVGAWVLSAGEGGRLWNSFKQDGVAAIGWDEMGDLGEYADRESLHAALATEYGRPNPSNDSLALWQFSREMKEGDIVVAKRGRKGLLGWGRVTGAYSFSEDRDEYQHTRPVKWEPCESVEIEGGHGVAVKTLTDGSGWKHWILTLIQALEGKQISIRPDGSDRAYGINEALADLFLPRAHFQRILGAISRRKNLILQGPPGVGKTFIAKKVAWALIGRRTDDSVRMIQFHQSYSYEDFVQGWRPTEGGGFELRDGVFHAFCDRARRDLNTPHVFIIDEVNRGNLSRIFGELLMLIESDKRGPEYAIPLTYSDDGSDFSVPPNVHLLGMMNTADRSLAMVDYALRRRFAFVDLRPAYGTEAFHAFLLSAGIDPELVARIDQRMASLNREIRDDAKNLGPGFEIGHSYFVPTGEEDALDDAWFKDIVRTQIHPLLREYWFDDPGRVDEMVETLLA